MNHAHAKPNNKRIKVAFIVVVTFTLLAGVLQLVSFALSQVAAADRSTIENTRMEQGRYAAKALNGDVSDASQGTLGKPSESSDSAENQLGAEQAATLRQLVLDGHSASDKEIVAIAADRREFTNRVEFIDQYEVLPAGCEIVALSVVLRSMGYDVDPQDLADNYVEFEEPFPLGYSGSPYDFGCGLPPCIAAAGDVWLSEHATSFRAYDTTGTPFDTLAALAETGYPVLVWSTEEMVEPSDIEEYDGYVWYWPFHCVTLYGQDGDSVLICDSILGMVDYERAEFADVFEACHSMSVVLLPV